MKRQDRLIIALFFILVCFGIDYLRIRQNDIMEKLDSLELQIQETFAQSIYNANNK